MLPNLSQNYLGDEEAGEEDEAPEGWEGALRAAPAVFGALPSGTPRTAPHGFEPPIGLWVE